MYIIDGHNLIPKLPGGSLSAIDDENHLIELLQAFIRARRKIVDVFFDGAPPGQAGVRRYGYVTAHFVAAGLTADDAIRRFLVQKGKAARNVRVVSSDRQVQANARALHAQVISSEVFANELGNLHAEPPASTGGLRPGRKPGSTGPSISPGELSNWYELFGIDPGEAEKPIEPPPQKRSNPGPQKKKKKH